MSNIAMKSLSQDELTILSNIESAISELKQMNAGAQSVEQKAMPEENQEEIKEAEDKAPEEVIPEDEEKIKKETTETPSDVATGTDTAEERIKDRQSEASEEQVNEVARSLAKTLLGIKTEVKKSKQINPIVAAIEKIGDTIKYQDQKIESVSKALSAFMDGFGITEQLELAKKEAIPEKNRRGGITSTDQNQVVKMLTDVLSKIENKDEISPYMSNSNVVQKNLVQGGMLDHILNK